MNTRSCVLLPLALTLWFWAGDYTLASKELSRAISHTGRAIAKARVFSNLSPTVDLKKDKKTLQKILAVKTKEIIALAKVGKAAKDLPFDLSPSRPRKLIVDERFTSMAKSQRAIIIYFAKAYGALCESMAMRKSILTYGICNLLAQEMTSQREMTTCPYLEVETTIAALLVKKRPQLLPTLFSGGNWQFEVNQALQLLGCHSPPHTFALLTAEIDGKTNVEKALADCLPNTKEALLDLVKESESTLANVTYRLVLLNICYDKLCQLIANDIIGQEIPPNALLEYAVAGDLDSEGKELLANLKMGHLAVSKAIERELRLRSMPDGYCAKKITYSPSIAKWGFRFFHNYSEKLATNAIRMRKKLETQQGLKDRKAQNRALIKHLNSKKRLAYWASEPHLQEFMKRFGKPQISATEKGG